MGDGLAVKAHDIERRQGNTVGFRPLPRGGGMGLGDGQLSRTGCRRFLLGPESCPDQAARGIVIDGGEGRPERRHGVAIGLDQGHIDAIDRGTAHQAKGAQGPL